VDLEDQEVEVVLLLEVEQVLEEQLLVVKEMQEDLELVQVRLSVIMLEVVEVELQP
jgi:hypothetical protein